MAFWNIVTVLTLRAINMQDLRYLVLAARVQADGKRGSEQAVFRRRL